MVTFCVILSAEGCAEMQVLVRCWERSFEIFFKNLEILVGAYLAKMGSTKIVIGASSWHLQRKRLKDSFQLEAGINLGAEE